MSFRNYYDTSSYGRSRNTARSSAVHSTERPTSVTAKYLTTTPSYKTSSIPILCRDKSATRDETPISAIASRYSSYKSNKDDKPSTKYEKKDYTKLTVPNSLTDRNRDVSPASTSSKYSLSRSSRHQSPERKVKTSIKGRSPDPNIKEREKDIPSKTEKVAGFNNISSFKLYPRTSSYSRPSSRTEIKPEITVNRYAIANRLSSHYLRSPSIEKNRSSVSPSNSADVIKSEITVTYAPVETKEDDNITQNNDENVSITSFDDNKNETITIVTRHTSPTPPGSSVYVRTRRADMAKTIERTITRPRNKPQMVDKEIQSDRLDDSTRSSRFGNTTRASVTSWTTCAPTSSLYTGYAGRYSTQYSTLREINGSTNCYSDRSSRSRSKEPQVKDNIVNNNLGPSDVNETEYKSAISNNTDDVNPELLTVYNHDKDDNTSEIIINVNLKLKKTKSPLVLSAAELVSPEITITNSHLPPQAPKTEITSKPKKLKARKSSTDSNSDTSTGKKKIIKKRAKSISSNDSDPGSDANSSSQTHCKGKEGSSNTSKKKSNSNLANGAVDQKYSKSRESNSPESSILSTQSSISEDENTSKSKTNELSRTSADEVSIPTDRSAKHSSLIGNNQKNEGTEDAKSFLIRALAPVTNLFKNRNHDSGDSRWLESSTSESTGKDVSNILTESESISKNKTNTDDIVASNEDNVVKLKAIRHIESGERAWWLESDSNKNLSDENHNGGCENNVPKKIRHIESGERAWWLDKKSSDNDSNCQSAPVLDYSDKLNNKRNVSDEDKPWWLDSNASVPDGVERLSPPRKTSSESEKSEKYDFFKVRHMDSGDKKDWWLSSSEKSSSNIKQETHNSLSKSNSDQKSFPNHRIRHIESGERPWWLSSSQNIPEGIEKLPTPPPPPAESDSSDSEEVQVYVPPSTIPPFPTNLPDDEPLGDRRSPEGLETPRDVTNYERRSSFYENDNYDYGRNHTSMGYKKSLKYISRYTDIDDILGTCSQIYSPFMDSILARRTGQVAHEDDNSECEEIDSTQVKIHDSTAQRPVIKKLRSRSEIIDCRDENQYLNDLDPFMELAVREPARPLYHTFNTTIPLSYQIAAVHRLLQAPQRLDDAALQVFKDGEYGAYLDLDSTLGEQEEELEGLQDSRKNAIILRTQLSVRVHTLIERLLHSQGRELRRALFTLKQVLQSDDDLVHEFVANKGLDCLMQLGNMADHNYLDYILRALGQILLYVDGMHGVMAHKRCIQWLYSLVSSKFRHVVKTALKLLLVFVEYTEENCLLLIDAITIVDSSNGRLPWYNVMKILQDVDASDTELLIYATNLINKCLNNIPDRNVYYDHVDALQDQGMDEVIQLYMSKQGTDLDLLRQLQIFEAVLLYEDGDETGTALKQLDDSIINSLRQRSMKSNSAERRKSKKFLMKEKEKSKHSHLATENKISINSKRSPYLPVISDSKESKDLSAALKRRRDRYARHAHHIVQQQELMNNSNNIYNELFISGNSTCANGNFPIQNESHVNGNHHNIRRYSTPIPSYTATSEDYEHSNAFYNYTNGVTNGQSHTKKSHDLHNGHLSEDKSSINRKARSFNVNEVVANGNQRYTSGLKQRIQNGTLGHSVTALDALTAMRQKQFDTDIKDERSIIINKEHSIKDIAQRLTSPTSPVTEDKPPRVAEMAGIVSKAKEELAKSQSKEKIKSPTLEIAPKIHEVKVSENDLYWEELKKGCLHREYHLCDLDFSDLRHDSDDDVSSASVSTPGAPPPPPPAMFPLVGAPPPPPVPFSPFSRNTPPAPPPKAPSSSERSNNSDNSTIRKNKKTVKLFWREIQENPIPITLRSKIGGFIWDDLPDIKLDTKMLEHLFESRSNDLIIKEKITEPKRNLILDAKRSNAINIAMKKLPTPQTIKAAIMKMDATVIGREGIEKLLTMLPTEEEKVKIQEAQYANPDLPLGSAEQFLLTLASISELSSRLKLWVFKLDFDNLEKEIAEPLMDLKQGIELLKVNKTFKAILSTLRSVGSFLNGSLVKGFRLDYLSKVMEVKDTVHKHPLLYHICEMIIEKFPDSTDFFSEVGPVIRASKVDFDMLNANLTKVEADCKASWDHMKRVAKHDGSQIFKTKINEFLKDAAERIILLSIIKKRVMNRYVKFLLYLGVPLADIDKTKPSDFLKVIAEFALEYRTSRERVLLQLEKKANHRERNKTRGKMIIDVGNYTTKNGTDNSADNALKELLKTDPYTDSISDSRRKLSQPCSTRPINGDMSAEDEIIESLVRSATSKRQPQQRERRRNNRLSSDKKKSFHKRTLSPQRQQPWPARENSPGSGAAQQR